MRAKKEIRRLPVNMKKIHVNRLPVSMTKMHVNRLFCDTDMEKIRYNMEELFFLLQTFFCVTEIFIG